MVKNSIAVAWMLLGLCGSSCDGTIGSGDEGDGVREALAFQQCGAANPAQQGQCHPSRNGLRCAPSAASVTGFAWTKDLTCLFAGVSCGANPAEQNNCGPNGQRCAANPVSPTGFAWANDVACVFAGPQCGGMNPAQKGQCHPSMDGKRCAANPASPTGFAWVADATCFLTQCGGKNPQQRGQCNCQGNGQRCMPAPTPTGYAWTADPSCNVPCTYHLYQSCKPNLCAPRDCTTPPIADPNAIDSGLACSLYGEICNTPGGARAFVCRP